MNLVMAVLNHTLVMVVLILLLVLALLLSSSRMYDVFFQNLETFLKLDPIIHIIRLKNSILP